jgi:hypothetical protein
MDCATGMLTRAAVLAVVAAAAAASHSPPIARLDPPARAGSLAPNLALDGKNVLFSWLEPAHARVKPQDGNYALRMSSLVNGRWSEPSTIAAGKDFFANWADFPSVTSAGGGRLFAHWAAKSAADTYAYDVRLARSIDGGRTWIPMGAANDDRTPTEHGFVSAVAEGAGVRLFWLDGRDTAGGRGTMGLRTALVADRIGASELLDSRVCDCCQTAAATTSDGPVVVFRDRTKKEIRDTAIIRREGTRWTQARDVHPDGWEIEGCPVNGPAVAVSRRKVAVAWFTQEANRPRVKVAFSNDAGASFGAPATIDSSGPLGRVDVVLDENGDALVAWVAAEGKAAAIRLARVTARGRMGAAITIARTETSRASGFPRLERSGGILVVVWVEPSEPSRIRAATLPASRVR